MTIDTDILVAGMDELLSKGIPTWLTLTEAERWLYDGRLSQDDYELYKDLWLTGTFRFSVSEDEIKAAVARLEKRYG